MQAKSLQSCLTLCDPKDCSPPAFSAHGRQGKNTGVDCHALLQGIFPIQGLNLCLLCLLHWQAGSLPLVPTGKPILMTGSASFFFLILLSSIIKRDPWLVPVYLSNPLSASLFTGRVFTLLLPRCEDTAVSKQSEKSAPAVAVHRAPITCGSWAVGFMQCFIDFSLCLLLVEPMIVPIL